MREDFKPFKLGWRCSIRRWPKSMWSHKLLPSFQVSLFAYERNIPLDAIQIFSKSDGAKFTVGSSELLTVALLAIKCSFVNFGPLLSLGNKCIIFLMFLSSPTNVYWQGMSSPLCTRSHDYRLGPVTLHFMSPPFLRNIEHRVLIFLRTCPTMALSLRTATACGSLMLPDSVWSSSFIGVQLAL